MEKINIVEFVNKFKAIKPITLQGRSFINENLQRLLSGRPSKATINFILEAADKVDDAIVKQFAYKTSKELNKGSVSYILEMQAEQLLNSESAYKNKAGIVVEELSNAAEQDAISAIVVNKALDNFNMYPEVSSIIKLAKNQYSTQSSSVAAASGSNMVVCIEADYMGWPVSGKFYVMQNDNSLSIATTQPSANAIAMLSAMQIIPFNNNRFSADSCIGQVSIVEAENVELDGTSIPLNAFVERLQAYMQTNTNALSINDDIHAIEQLNNALVVLAANFNMVSVLTDSIYVPASRLALYANNGKFFVISAIDSSMDNITTYTSIIDMVEGLQSMDQIALANMAREKWGDLYDAAVINNANNAGKTAAFLQLRTEVLAKLQSAKAIQAEMESTSEGFAAYQQIIDAYNAQLATIEVGMNEPVNEGMDEDYREFALRWSEDWFNKATDAGYRRMHLGQRPGGGEWPATWNELNAEDKKYVSSHAPSDRQMKAFKKSQQKGQYVFEANAPKSEYAKFEIWWDVASPSERKQMLAKWGKDAGNHDKWSNMASSRLLGEGYSNNIDLDSLVRFTYPQIKSVKTTWDQLPSDVKHDLVFADVMRGPLKSVGQDMEKMSTSQLQSHAQYASVIKPWLASMSIDESYHSRGGRFAKFVNEEEFKATLLNILWDEWTYQGMMEDAPASFEKKAKAKFEESVKKHGKTNIKAIVKENVPSHFDNNMIDELTDNLTDRLKDVNEALRSRGGRFVNEAIDMSGLSIGLYASYLLQSVTEAHRFHLNNEYPANINAFATHKILDTYYKDLPELVDELVEQLRYDGHTLTTTNYTWSTPIAGLVELIAANDAVYEMVDNAGKAQLDVIKAFLKATAWQLTNMAGWSTAVMVNEDNGADPYYPSDEMWDSADKSERLDIIAGTDVSVNIVGKSWNQLTEDEKKAIHAAMDESENWEESWPTKSEQEQRIMLETVIIANGLGFDAGSIPNNPQGWPKSLRDAMDQYVNEAEEEETKEIIWNKRQEILKKYNTDTLAELKEKDEESYNKAKEELDAITKELSEDAEMTNESEAQDKYRAFFKKTLEKYNAKSPAELSKEDKTKFFNEIKSTWKSGSNADESMTQTSAANVHSFAQAYVTADATQLSKIEDLIRDAGIGNDVTIDSAYKLLNRENQQKASGILGAAFINESKRPAKRQSFIAIRKWLNESLEPGQDLTLTSTLQTVDGSIIPAGADISYTQFDSNVNLAYVTYQENSYGVTMVELAKAVGI